MPRIYIWNLAMIFALTACGSAQVIRISSTPPGAEITTLTGEVVGSTPLELSPALIEKLSNQGSLRFRATHEGSVGRTFITNIQNLVDYDFALEPLSPQAFKSSSMNTYAQPTNQMVREILTIQAILMAKKYSDAKIRIVEFQKNYPNVAASYVLQANVALKENDINSAVSSLKRAQTLDPSDEVAARMLAQIQSPKKDAAP